MAFIPDSLSDHSPSFCVGAKKGHNLIHIPTGWRSSGRSPIRIPRITFNPRYPHGSKSTTIFTYT
jgi:hypothetical protein